MYGVFVEVLAETQSRYAYGVLLRGGWSSSVRVWLFSEHIPLNINAGLFSKPDSATADVISLPCTGLESGPAQS